MIRSGFAIRPTGLFYTLAAITAALILAAVTLGVLSAREMQGMIRAAFDARQLAGARYAAGVLAQRFRQMETDPAAGIGPQLRPDTGGYAWIVDDAGRFRYHPDPARIGSSLPEPANTPVADGREGIFLAGPDWFPRGAVSGQRPIAFAPVRLPDGGGERTWSVAVAADNAGMRRDVRNVYLRLGTMQVAFALAVLIVVFSLRANEMRWVRRLERDVHEKTREIEDHARRLEASEERYRSLVESADDLICAVDPQGRIQAINACWTRLTGQDTCQATGLQTGEIISFSHPEGIQGLIAEAIEAPGPVSREEVVEIAGRKYWLDVKVSRVSGDSGENGCEAPSLLIIARDITEHRRVEAQLFNSQKLAALGELSAGVAHEINNPVAIILGFTEILLENQPAGTREHEILKTIERQGENARRIVEKLLAFARVPGEETADTDVTEAIERIIEVVKNTLLTKKVDLRTALPETVPRVRGERSELEQVFLNIINNAIAAMEDGGILSVRVERHGETVRIEFRDTGTGIAPEHREKVFEPFFTTKPVGEGTGLGLAVSYGIVHKLGGAITVESRTAAESPDPGTVFTVRLPVCQPSAGPGRTADSDQPSDSGR